MGKVTFPVESSTRFINQVTAKHVDPGARDGVVANVSLGEPKTWAEAPVTMPADASSMIMKQKPGVVTPGFTEDS